MTTDRAWDGSPRQEGIPLTQEHFGEVGKREVFNLTVLTVKVILREEYDPITLVRFTDPENRLAVWFASGNKEDQWEVGKSYPVKATVKQHGEYHGDLQTIISRVKVQE